MFAAVIYADNSKLVRRIFLDESEAVLQKAASVVPGESVLSIASDVYDKFSSVEEFYSYVAGQIGSPTHSGNCVEVSPKGQVVSRFLGDPDIDKPAAGNTIEIHETAHVGDVKLAGTAEFVPMKPVVEKTKQQILDDMAAYAAAAGKPVPADASQTADKLVADQAALKAKQAQAANQVKP